MKQKETGLQWVVADADETGESEAVKREADALEHGDVGQLGSVGHVTETGSHIGVQEDSLKEKKGVERAPDGKLLPGTRSLNPSGRKPRAHEAAMIQALKDSLPPEKLRQWVDRALELADEQRSTRGIIATLSFAMAYGLGKPVSATIPKGEKSALIEALLQDDSDPLAPAADASEA